jgi:hypothetical protein
MVWMIYSVSHPGGATTSRVVQMGAIRAESEHEARGCAMRLYREGAKRVLVRSPAGPTMISGSALEEWLTDRLSGGVRGGTPGRPVH